MTGRPIWLPLLFLFLAGSACAGEIVVAAPFAKVRDWTDARGRTIHAAPVRFDERKIELRKPGNPKLLSVSRSTLSTEDQQWLERYASFARNARIEDGSLMRAVLVYGLGGLLAFLALNGLIVWVAGQLTGGSSPAEALALVLRLLLFNALFLVILYIIHAIMKPDADSLNWIVITLYTLWWLGLIVKQYADVLDIPWFGGLMVATLHAAILYSLNAGLRPFMERSLQEWLMETVQLGMGLR